MKPSRRGRSGGGGGRHHRANPPAQRVVELVIEEIGGRGDGIAHLDGDTVFVPYTVPGDHVLARIESKRGDALVATPVEVLAVGAQRALAPCSHYGICGGCSLQHLDAEAYRAWKSTQLTQALARQGLGEVATSPLIAVSPGTRRRATFGFLHRRGGLLLGFNARTSHMLVGLEECHLLAPALADFLPGLRDILRRVIPEGGKGDVTVTAAENGLDVVVDSRLDLDLAAREALAEAAGKYDLARLSWRQPGSGFAEPVAARRPPLVSFAGIPVSPPPGAFLQPSKAGEDAIASLVVDALGEARMVADLYSGCGSFTFPIATRAAVHAVEGDEALIAALQMAADRAGPKLRVTSEARDLARRPLLAPELKRFDAIVFDPPRAGAAAQVEILAEAGPPVLVGVSCNPATLARDARMLVDGGYRLDSVTPIDQFPWSAHLEAVAVFRR
ncbi:class I SAM-dependent RNA methyltransferase [Telmatospirillum sp. J64-1]|uniref:class I SAM-dependent RNA methyltransferase n=1 Tax=Telmatospirillum sp. J64-1 TaxID=2502183 RepID=UPI00115E3FCB|nr:class I SAM-dependent RNA methyltransferase [Telmatospirillum sp. J64-1]